MKKLVVFAMAVMMAAVSYGQILGFRPVMHVPDTAAKFPMQMKIGDLVYVKSTHTLYELAVAVGISKNMNYILASASRYNYPSITAASTMAVTTNATVGGYLTVTGKLTTADTVQGAKLKITGNGAVGGTLGVTGLATFTLGAIMTASDTTTKTAGRIVYLNGNFYGANGTYFLKLNN